MIGQLFVLLPAAAQLFLGIFFVRADDVLAAIFGRPVNAVDQKCVRTVAYALRIGKIESAFTDRQVMYGVEQVGFAGSVVAYQAVDLRRKLDMGFRNVLEVYQRQFVEVHKVVFTFPKILNFREYSAARGFLLPGCRREDFAGVAPEASKDKKDAEIVLISLKKVTFAFRKYVNFNF